MGGQQPECARGAFKMDSPRRPCIPRLKLHCSAPYGRHRLGVNIVIALFDRAHI